METNKLLLMLLSISIITGIGGCDKNDDEIKPEKQITFENMEILYNVLPSGNYTAIRFTSQNTAYTLTNNGRIFKTEDGGNTWIQQDSGTELYLYDMFFFDDLRGYIVGGHSNGIILKTTDGGETWLSTDFQGGLSSVCFINETTGFAVGQKLFKTRDSGETWNEVDLGYLAYGSLNFFDEKIGFLTAGNILLKTTDGGNNWLTVNNNVIGNRSIKKIRIFDNIACLLSTGTTIFITSDKGMTWYNIDPPTLNSVHFINERQAVGVGQHWYELGYFPNGMLCITNDGGKYWEEKYFPADEFLSINDIDFPNDSIALVVGNSPQGCVIKLNF